MKGKWRAIALGVGGVVLLLTMAVLVLVGLAHRLRGHPQSLATAVLTDTLLLCLLLICVLTVTGLLLYRSQRRKAMLLEAERERYYLFSQLAGAYLFDFDYATRTVRVSGEGSDDTPITLAQARELCHPDERCRLEALVRTPPARGEKQMLECRLRGREDTPYQWYECKAMAVFDGRGHPARLMGRLENITRRKAREETLVTRSTMDTLTGLLNKSAIALRTDELLDSPCAKNGGALLMLDLDNFKAINDQCGHAFGDQALLLTARVLREGFRRIDLLSRAGGDEFLIFLPGCGDRRTVWERACRLCRTLETRAEQSLGEHAFTCSVGLAFYPEDGEDFSALFDAADTAMYAAKRGGKNACALFEGQEMNG